MTLEEAKTYAERDYEQYLAPLGHEALLINRLTAAYIKGLLAYGAMDALQSENARVRAAMPVTQPITTTVNQPESEEWKAQV